LTIKGFQVDVDTADLSVIGAAGYNHCSFRTSTMLAGWYRHILTAYFSKRKYEDNSVRNLEKARFSERSRIFWSMSARQSYQLFKQQAVT
jgi:hypothetical protein